MRDERITETLFGSRNCDAVNRSWDPRIRWNRKLAGTLTRRLSAWWRDNWCLVHGMSREKVKQKMFDIGKVYVDQRADYEDRGSIWLFFAIELLKAVVALIVKRNWPVGQHPVVLKKG